MKAVTKIEWPNGDVTEREVNMDDPEQRRRFAHVARHALETGGRVTSVNKLHKRDWEEKPTVEKDRFTTLGR